MKVGSFNIWDKVFKDSSVISLNQFDIYQVDDAVIKLLKIDKSIVESVKIDDFEVFLTV